MITFVVDGVIVKFPRGVLRSQAVPQGEVIDGEQVGFIGESQEVPVRNKFDTRCFEAITAVKINYFYFIFRY